MDNLSHAARAWADTAGVLAGGADERPLPALLAAYGQHTLHRILIAAFGINATTDYDETGRPVAAINSDPMARMVFVLARDLGPRMLDGEPGQGFGPGRAAQLGRVVLRAHRGCWRPGGGRVQGVTMSERRDRRRLHARARALGVPIEQAGRRASLRRPARPVAQPAWPRTSMPDRDEAPAAVQAMPAVPVACCTVTRDRQVTDGGTVVVLTRHTADCPVWSAR
ncbi:hypothetical protein ACIGZJ_17355 [Kitasatospora sp. NPDC052868]|uniref:hypothetical protein n=1 Tax=Kitasatospora sp. NPDC052868 TaxID=3364060 RepID=UPI0037C5E617